MKFFKGVITGAVISTLLIEVFFHAKQARASEYPIFPYGFPGNAICRPQMELPFLDNDRNTVAAICLHKHLYVRYDDVVKVGAM